MEEFPFQQYINENKLVRTFTTDVDSEELVWHQDLRDRIVTVIEGNGWQFQMDNELPIELKSGDVLKIEKYNWHRVIKGSGNLIVEIEEY